MAAIDHDMLDEALEELDEAQTQQEFEDRLCDLFNSFGYRAQTYKEALMLNVNHGVVIVNQAGIEFRLTIHKHQW